MKKILLAMITLMVMLGVSFTPMESARQTEDPAVLLRAAIEKEEVDGDLQSAIALYKEIVAKYSDKSAIAAKAQLRIGICYEKLGNEEAVKAYEAVLSRFPKESEAVAEARSRLGALRKEEPVGLTITRLLPRGLDLEFQTLSPDGTKLAGIVISEEGQNVGVFDLMTKKSELITNYKGMEKSCTTSAAVWSPDSKEIAYWAACWGDPNEEGIQLRTTALDGKSRLLYRNTDEGGISPCDWLPDKSAVVAFVGKKDLSYSLCLISTKDGARRDIFPIQRTFGYSDKDMVEASGSADASPDGRFIVFSDGPSDGNRDIYIIAEDGGSPVILTDHPADDKEPRWSPDGRHIVFLSLRHGSWALWGISVEDGKPEGAPFMILEGMQNAQLVSWIKKGLVSRTSAWISDIYTVEIDPVSHDLQGKPELVDFSTLGMNRCAAWSPDGMHLAFISRSIDQPAEGYVVVLPAGGGTARKFTIPTHRFSDISLHDLRWLPDSSGLGFSHWDSDNHYSLFRLLLATGEWKTWPIPNTNFSSIEWGGDGRTFIYAKGIGKPDELGLVERNLETGQERYLLHAQLGLPYTWPIKTSRDYKKLARDSDDGKIELIDKATGKVARLEWEKEKLSGASWSPDGKYLAASGRVDDQKGPMDLFIVSVTDGKLKALNIGQYLPPGGRIAYPDWSPDGQRIAFHSRTWRNETNLVQNVIPKK